MRALPAAPLLLGPEPIIEARSITLVLQGRSLSLASDGLRPFAALRPAADGDAFPSYRLPSERNLHGVDSLY